MDSEKKNVQCVVCGGTEYVKEIGFYYCVECQTQSQELREEVFDLKYDASGIPLNTSTKAIPSVKKSDDCVEWTTWEAYNFILRGQVEELMSMGASEKFKYTVLQLWAYYLNKLEVAFTSQSSKELPKIGPSYHEKDRNLVYGTPATALKKLKRKKRQSLSDANSVSTSFSDELVARKLFRQSKRALMELETTQHSQNLESSRDQSTILNLSAVKSEKSSTTSTVRPLTRTAYSKAARKVWKTKQRTRKWSSVHKVLKEKRLLHYTNPNTLSRFRLLVLLHIALMCSREKIQLSDILRWVREGHLAYYEISHLLPSNYCIKGRDHLIFSPEVYLPSYSTILKTAKNLARLLNVSNWIKPNLLDLAGRFLKELQLPAVLVTLVERFLVTAPFLNAYDQKKLPNFEVRVVAIIIIILKLLLGLDGKTEDVISATASKINSISWMMKVSLCFQECVAVLELSNEVLHLAREVNITQLAHRLLSEQQISSQLFVWHNWVQFIVCRKALVVQYHFPTRDRIASEVYIQPQVYINCWVQMRDRCGPSKVVPCRSISKLLVSSMKQPFLNLKGSDSKEVEKLDFPPTLTPYYSYVEEILSVLPNGEEMTARNILSQDFTAMDLEYLLRPAMLQNCAESKNIKICVKKKSAQHTSKTVKPIEKHEINFSISHQKLVYVHIVREKDRKKSQKKDRKKSREKYPRRESDTVRKENIIMCRDKEDFHVNGTGLGGSDEDLATSQDKNRKGNLHKVDQLLQLNNDKSGESGKRLTRSKSRRIKRNTMCEDIRTLAPNEDKSCEESVVCCESEKGTIRLGEGHGAELDIDNEECQIDENRLDDSREALSKSSVSARKKQKLCKSLKTLQLNGDKSSHYDEGSIVNRLNKEKTDTLDNTVNQGTMSTSSVGSCQKTKKLKHLPFSTLPDEARILLLKHLAVSQKKESGVSLDKKLELHLPHPEYWMLECSIEDMDENTFENKVFSKLPLSFSWLLVECAQMLEMSKMELYHEIVVVESLCTDILRQ